MPLNSQKLFENAIMYLSVLRYIIKSRTKKGLYDLNKQCEPFFCELLNAVCGWHLVNLNQIQSNYPAIDLGDTSNRICVQVTAQNDSTKINKTIEKFVTKKLYKKYDRLIVFVLTDKKTYAFSPNTQGAFQFDKDADIWDIDDLLTQIESASLSSLTDIHDFLEAELASVVSVLADKSSLLIRTEKKVQLPPANATKFLEHLEYTSEEIAQGRRDISKFYDVLSSLPKRSREYLYVIATRGESSSLAGLNSIEIQPRALESLLGLSRHESIEEFNILEAKGLASLVDDDPPTIGISFRMDTDVEIIDALRDYCADDDHFKTVIVECDFTSLDQ